MTYSGRPPAAWCRVGPWGRGSGCLNKSAEAPGKVLGRKSGDAGGWLRLVLLPFILSLSSSEWAETHHFHDTLPYLAASLLPANTNFRLKHANYLELVRAVIHKKDFDAASSLTRRGNVKRSKPINDVHAGNRDAAR